MTDREKMRVIDDLIGGIAGAQTHNFCGPCEQPKTTIELLRRVDLDAEFARRYMKMLAQEPDLRPVVASCTNTMDNLQGRPRSYAVSATKPRLYKPELESPARKRNCLMEITNIDLPSLMTELPRPPELTDQQRKQIKQLNSDAVAMNQRVSELRERMQYIADHPHHYGDPWDLVSEYRTLSELRIVLYHAFWSYHARRRAECLRLYRDIEGGGLSDLITTALDAVARGRELEKAGYTPEAIEKAMKTDPVQEKYERRNTLYRLGKDINKLYYNEVSRVDEQKTEAVKETIGYVDHAKQ